MSIDFLTGVCAAVGLLLMTVTVGLLLIDAWFKAKERFVERLIQKGMRRPDAERE